jgi:hypothetical protein
MVKLITLCDSSVVIMLCCIEKVLININYAGANLFLNIRILQALYEKKVPKI